MHLHARKTVRRVVFVVEFFEIEQDAAIYIVFYSLPHKTPLLVLFSKMFGFAFFLSNLSDLKTTPRKRPCYTAGSVLRGNPSLTRGEAGN